MITKPKPQHEAHLVVVNPNPAPAREQSEANMLLVRTARLLFNLARKRECRGIRLWYWTTTEHSERDKCLQVIRDAAQVVSDGRPGMAGAGGS